MYKEVHITIVPKFLLIPIYNRLVRKMKHIHITMKVNTIYRKHDSHNIQQKKHDTCTQYDSFYIKLKNLVKQNHTI